LAGPKGGDGLQPIRAKQSLTPSVKPSGSLPAACNALEIVRSSEQSLRARTWIERKRTVVRCVSSGLIDWHLPIGLNGNLRNLSEAPAASNPLDQFNLEVVLVCYR